MTFKLEAISPLDATGIFRVGQSLRLVRPPFLLRDCPILPDDSVADAVLKHGFFASEEVFTSWNDAISFLNREVEARRSIGSEIPESISGIDVMDAAPADVLRLFLNRVEEELIPKRLFAHAENLLLNFLSSSALRRFPEMGARVAVLLSQAKAKHGQLERIARAC